MSWPEPQHVEVWMRPSSAAPSFRVRVASSWRPPRFALTWSDGGALLAVMLWGFSFPITKYLIETFSPVSAMFLRLSLASVLFAAVLIAAGQWRLPRRADVLPLLALGLLGQALGIMLWAEGLRLTTASHSGLLYTLTPLIVFGISHALGQLRISRRDLVGLALGVLGAALIVGAPVLAGSDVEGASIAGDLLVAAGAVVWSLWTLLSTGMLRRYGTLRVTAWITMISAAGLAPLALAELLALDWRTLPWQVYGGIAYSGSLSGVLGGLLWYGAVRRLGAARTVIYANMESLFVILSSAFLLGERVEATALVGGAAVIAGVLLTRRPEAS